LKKVPPRESFAIAIGARKQTEHILSPPGAVDVLHGNTIPRAAIVPYDCVSGTAYSTISDKSINAGLFAEMNPSLRKGCLAKTPRRKVRKDFIKVFFLKLGVLASLRDLLPYFTCQGLGFRNCFEQATFGIASAAAIRHNEGVFGGPNERLDPFCSHTCRIARS